jgi:A/G-specific adenine glycosylase
VVHELLDWFDAERRPLPWRVDRTPYRVLVSEIMLQQTQVATVLPYYRRWLARFPDLPSLAAAPLDDALKLWEGLGYYRRARRLHRTAIEVVHRFGGRLPSDPDVLATLPGVGRYTAAAVASIAFGVPTVAVDTHVARIAARLWADPDSTPARAHERFAALQPADRPGDFNEALMELGALVCSARSPGCERCPISASCAAYASGVTDKVPRSTRKRTRPRRTRYALVARRPGSVALRRRSADEMLAGLWGFVQQEAPPPEASLLAPIRHGYTHFELTLVPAVISSLPPSATWVATSELDDLALSKVDRLLLAALGDTDPQVGAEPSPISDRAGGQR